MTQPKNQMDHLKEHLKSGRTISSLEALGLYGSFRLAARIKELRLRGWGITSTMKRDPNGKTYAVYALAPQNDHGLPAFAHAPSQLNTQS